MNVIKPPQSLTKYLHRSTRPNPSIFLAGSIEMGVAQDWQSVVETALCDIDVAMFNPRRDSWDSSWEQKISNPHFREQVEWELTALRCADVIIMYFDPETKSPISLLEFGLFAASGKLIVCCPDGFYRKGNIEVVSNYYGVPMFSTLGDAIDICITRLNKI